jgi:hypothetical protein
MINCPDYSQKRRQQVCVAENTTEEFPFEENIWDLVSEFSLQKSKK